MLLLLVGAFAVEDDPAVMLALLFTCVGAGTDFSTTAKVEVISSSCSTDSTSASPSSISGIGSMTFLGLLKLPKLFGLLTG